MRPIRTDETTGIYGAPPGLEEVVGGLPFWRETVDGLPEVRSVWTFDPDEKEAVALGGNLLLGIVGEPIPPVSLVVLSPIDVPAFGMPAADPLQLSESYQAGDSVGLEDHHDDGLIPWILAGAILVLLVLGFLVGRLTA